MHLSSLVIYSCLTIYISKVNGQFFCSVQKGASCDTTVEKECCVADYSIAICNSPVGHPSGNWVVNDL